MKQEDKELLLKDLSARLPYGVKIMFSHNGFRWDWAQTFDRIEKCEDGDYAVNGWGIHGIKPYLRPLSSMTEEEKQDFIKSTGNSLRYSEVFNVIKSIEGCGDYCIDAGIDAWLSAFDWLNKNHFNYRLPKRLYIEVTKENNPYK